MFPVVATPIGAAANDWTEKKVLFVGVIHKAVCTFMAVSFSKQG